jgi:hypothetical protein
MPTKAGKDPEGRKTPPNQIGKTMEFEHGERDGVHIPKVRLLFSFLLFCGLLGKQFL